MSKLSFSRLPFSKVLVAIAVTLLPLAQRGWAQSALFDLQMRPVSELEIADGAPAGTVLDLFVTTDRDMHFVYLSESVPDTFYQHEFGTDTSAPPSAINELYPAMGVDSWFTSPGSTSLAGTGFNEVRDTGSGGISAWFDFTDDGSLTDFQFGRLTIPTGTAASLWGEIQLRGGEAHLFELAVDTAGEISWETFDPLPPEPQQPKPEILTPEPITPVVVTPITPSTEAPDQNQRPVVIEVVEHIPHIDIVNQEWLDIDVVVIDPTNRWNPQPVDWNTMVAIDVLNSPYLIDMTNTIELDFDSEAISSLSHLAYTSYACDGPSSFNVFATASENAVIPEPSSMAIALLCVAVSSLIRTRNQVLTQF